MSYLIDTNVISELRKPSARRNPGVQRWFDQVESGDLFLSVGMKLVTRNVGDLADWPYPGLLLNPFESS